MMPRTAVFVFCLPCFLAFAAVVNADSPGVDEPGAETISTQFVPDDAIVVAAIRPVELMKSPAIRHWPIEVARVYVQETFAVDLSDLNRIRFVGGLGPRGPVGGVIIESDVDLDLDRIVAGLKIENDLVDVDGWDAVVIEAGPDPLLVHVIDDNTLYVGVGSYLEPVVTAGGDSDSPVGPVSTLLSETVDRPGLNIVVAFESIRPMISGVANEVFANLAPELRLLAELPARTDGIRLNVNLVDDSAEIRLALVGGDPNDAAEIERIVLNGFDAIRDLVLDQLRRDGEAAGQSPAGIASSGALAGLLIPAVMSGSSSARMMSLQNNFKRVMLAMHNYHSAYRQLPLAAITDEDGEPLLSWRVALLPFVEEQALWEQFRKDEPFVVGMGDGRVQAFSQDMGAEEFVKRLTRAGREVLGN